MKFIVLILSLFTVGAQATYQHECKVNVTVQIYSKDPFGIKDVIQGSSAWFEVTKQEHEDPYQVEIFSKNHNFIGKANVWTGTLLNSNVGDVLQAHVNVDIRSMKTDLSLLMSVKSPFASTTFNLESETDSELTFVPVDLSCRIKNLLK